MEFDRDRAPTSRERMALDLLPVNKLPASCAGWLTGLYLLGLIDVVGPLVMQGWIGIANFQDENMVMLSERGYAAMYPADAVPARPE